jgi:hypothetical protein
VGPRRGLGRRRAPAATTVQATRRPVTSQP